MILGDGGYACRTFLMTPFINPTERHKQRYNRSHATTRCVIERAFGILKRRFHVLHSEVIIILFSQFVQIKSEMS